MSGFNAVKIQFALAASRMRSGFRAVAKPILVACFLGLCLVTADETRSSLERGGDATIIHKSDVVPADGKHLWSLYSSPEARMNYFEVTGRTGLHFHPDADHRLYVLEGELLLTAGTNTTTAKSGDFIVIPKGVRHSYDVPQGGGRALLLTFDAPPYDPAKTVNLEKGERAK
jgi:quercetin dioxygenase-like cupin family protein